jgi:NAD(P)-dependent dehydrogenase (short-subunit alcohol dehydrogenase family)
VSGVAVNVVPRRVFLITGASDGIGSELAVALAQPDADLVLAARRENRLQAVVRRCESAGARALAVRTDVSEPEECRGLVGQAMSAFGGIDVLVNNAGISMYCRLDEVTDLSVFERLVRVNYLGAVFCTYHALPHLKARRGLVVAVSSLQGKTGFPGYSGYSASKHAMQGFFDSLRIELAGSGVDVLVVSPGPVATNIHVNRLGPDGSAAVSAPQGQSQDMPVDECVRQIVRAMRGRRRELLMTAGGKALPWLKLVSPAAVDRLVARAVARYDAGR